MDIIESNLQFKELQYGNNPIMLVLHHAEASKCTIQDIHQWHLNNGWAGCGYHFFVNKQGQVFRGRPENAIGAHCPGVNDHSLGICAEGEYMSETMPQEQKNAIVDLEHYLTQKYGIKQIYGHKELYNTSCPGTNYPLQEIKDLIINQEVIDMKKIVVYFGDADIFAAVPVSQKYGCPLMKKADYDASGLKADEVIQIGGKPNSTRVSTFKDAANLL